MLHFSTDPAAAERQMEALIFALTTFGYIDGDFDDAEKAVVRGTIETLVERRVDTGMPDASDGVRNELIERFAQHFLERFEQIDRQVNDLFHEPVAKNEDRDTFVLAKLEQRCFELFQGFDRANQDAILDAVDELILADGELHPAELQFRRELSALLDEDLDFELVEEDDGPRASVVPAIVIPADDDHPFFRQFEFHYSSDPETIGKQIEADLELVGRVIASLDARREEGQGRLSGKAKVDDFEPGTSFLDGWTHVLRPVPGRSYDLTVLGDLHGCYSCLKGAVMQTRFFEKIEAFRQDPETHPEPKLVLLGDYIDRGIFSLNGVLRTAMQMVIQAPEHVYMLRGNHEYFVEHRGQIYGGVRPSEAINSLKPHLPAEVFRRYLELFDALPNSLLFDRTLFVHGGIPRDRLLKERWQDLSTLNDPEVRFQMMWSDPSAARIIPAKLQEQTARFPFGRMQFASFMRRLGCNTLIRGHEKVREGFKRVYDDEHGLLITLFSAGGAENRDLPPRSSYRRVTPMGLSILRNAEGETTITPFAIEWQAYNDPERNAFHQRPLEIQHRVE